MQKKICILIIKKKENKKKIKIFKNDKSLKSISIQEKQAYSHIQFTYVINGNISQNKFTLQWFNSSVPFNSKKNSKVILSRKKLCNIIDYYNSLHTPNLNGMGEIDGKNKIETKYNTKIEYKKRERFNCTKCKEKKQNNC